MQVVLGRRGRAGHATETQWQLIRRNTRGEVVLYDPIAGKVSVRKAAGRREAGGGGGAAPGEGHAVSASKALTRRSQRRVVATTALPHAHSSASSSAADFDVDPDYQTYSDVCPSCGQTTSLPGREPTHTWTTTEPLSTSFHPAYFRLLAKSDSETTSRINSPNTSDTEDGEPASVDGLPPSLFSLGYLKRFFREIKILGSGARGQVRLYQHVLDNVPLGLYAIKLIPCGHSRDWLQKVLSEATLLQRLRHPNIIAYHHTFLDHLRIVRSGFGPKVPTLCLLMDYANGSDLDHYLEQVTKQRRETRHDSKSHGRRPFLPLPTILSLMEDVCTGLAHLHESNICHLDLKAQNILLNYDDGDLASIPRAMLSDMGSCELLASASQGQSVKQEPRVRSGHTGTIEFLPPENLKWDPKTHRLRPLGKKADVWAAGCILHLLLFGRLMWTQVEDVETLGAEIEAYPGYQAGDTFSSTDQPYLARLSDLLAGMLSPNPAERPSISKALLSVQSIRHDYAVNEQNAGPESLDTSGTEPGAVRLYKDSTQLWTQDSARDWRHAAVSRPLAKGLGPMGLGSLTRTLASCARHGDKLAMTVMLCVACHAMDRSMCGMAGIGKTAPLLHLAVLFSCLVLCLRWGSWLVPLMHLAFVAVCQWLSPKIYTRLVCVGSTNASRDL